MRIATPVDAEGNTWPAWGRAHWVALATLKDYQVVDWQVEEVGWDVSHDAGTHGSHHAEVVRFLKDNEVGAIVVDHVGPGMERMLVTMGIPLLQATPGDARASVDAALARLHP